MHTQKFIKLVIGLVCALGVSACGTNRIHGRLTSPAMFERMQTLAVLPFDNLSPFPEAGEITSDLLASELRGWPGFEVRDRKWARGAAVDHGIAAPDRWTRAHAVELGRRAGIDVIALGSVIEYGYIREHRGLTEIAAVGLTLELISSETGRVLFSATVQRSGGSDLSPGRPPMNLVAAEALADMVAELFTQLATYQLDHPKRYIPQSEAEPLEPESNVSDYGSSDEADAGASEVDESTGDETNEKDDTGDDSLEDAPGNMTEDDADETNEEEVVEPEDDSDGGGSLLDDEDQQSQNLPNHREKVAS